MSGCLDFFPSVIKQVNLATSVVAGALVYYKLKRKKEVYSSENAIKPSCLFWTYFGGYIGRVHVSSSMCSFQSSERPLTHTELEVFFPPGCLQMICDCDFPGSSWNWSVL